MAIKRLDPKATFDIVSVFDDAIEHESSEELKALRESNEKSRYDKYLENFDLSVLKLKENQEPTIFRVRCLLSSEKAEIDNKYQVVDTEKKKIDYKDRQKMMLEVFEKACLGIVEKNGTVTKTDLESIEYKVATDLGAAITILGSLSKNLKKA